MVKTQFLSDWITTENLLYCVFFVVALLALAASPKGGKILPVLASNDEIAEAIKACPGIAHAIAKEKEPVTFGRLITLSYECLAHTQSIDTLKHQKEMVANELPRQLGKGAN